MLVLAPSGKDKNRREVTHQMIFDVIIVVLTFINTLVNISREIRELKQQKSKKDEGKNSPPPLCALYPKLFYRPAP